MFFIEYVPYLKLAPYVISPSFTHTNPLLKLNTDVCNTAYISNFPPEFSKI